MRGYAIVIATLAALSGPALAHDGRSHDGRLTVTGEGQAAAEPDMALVTVGVSEQADTAVAAMDAASAVADRMLSRLESLEVQPRDVQTTSLSLNPVYVDSREPGQRPRIDGYEASNNVTVRVRALDSLGDVLGALLEDGANTLGGLSFDVADPDPLLEAARRDAVQDARAKAELYAEAAGVTLGEIVTIDESGSGGGQPMPMAEMRAASVPIAAGETGYSATVRIVYDLER
ncbi:SIMPL domain-containing protein [Roseivivax sediminis]|uniref:26 kDa periplasmic immunogenic protein n=1 Tax=Roseivivax sediminis TaxID=936889 RepID=A0A1I1SEE3_9RHOB|nr:SIMPL domain-containing protein [Roseivivax sediminis]SFD44837.1 hypothetical protein SAMN04515678_101126 [Roseivivax sediminis]